MNKLRLQAFKEATSRRPQSVEQPSEKISEFYGQNVFSKYVMMEYLPAEAYKSVMEAIEKGVKIDRSIADQVASAMKDWAISKNATHYTHWFQPLTGATAEKHDAFIDPIPGGKVIERFAGHLLVQQEPDASSFPNGGIRNTFEARGYTAWDPTSPAFIIDKTLCIPTIFVAYTGEALDNKTPLLRALHAVDEAAVSVCQYFDKNVSKVNASLGWEQEYFLIDLAFYNARPDLIQTGRTLFGHSSPKGQQLDDHYFGSIPPRAQAFMRDFENESLKLGIPITTRHNEVAPNQFECAPVYEEANLSVDHNSLLMDLMEKVARRHNFKVLLHEKPFAGFNGSGKHNNWSLTTNTGKNLLSPGKTPKSNLQFLTFFINTIKAVYENSDLLRASIASSSNDHRLGANEAPPAIMSVFIGSQLTRVLNELETKLKGGKMSPEDKTDLKLNVVGKIPDVLLDNTDRNRTSPFAFTGNKFEFRAVGSLANCSLPMTVLNTIIADQLNAFKIEVDDLIDSSLSKDEAIFQVLKSYIKSSKPIRFEGDGYSELWIKEAAKRGLSNIKSTPYALDLLVSDKAKSVFSDNNVLSELELKARYEVYLEEYQLKIQIEAKVLTDLVKNHVIPSAVRYQSLLVKNVKNLQDILSDQDFKAASKEQISMIIELSNVMNSLITKINEMIGVCNKSDSHSKVEFRAKKYADNVCPYFDEIRCYTDKLELLVDDEMWPLPKYREMLLTS